MFARRLRVVSTVLATVDALLAVAAFAAAYGVRGQLLPELADSFPELPEGGLFPFSLYLPLLAGIVAIWLGTGFLMGVYRPRELRERRQAVLDPTRQILVGMLALAAALFFVKGFYVSRLLLLLFVVFDWTLQVAARLAYIEWGPRLRERLGDSYRILMVGTGARAQELARMIRESRQAGLRVVGWVETSAAGARELYGAPVHPLADVPRLLREQVIDEVLFAVGRDELERLEDLFLRCE
ncbi:MAG: nucleoside-diphosphate sugar epimerase/dehydratase, partial [Candidatus Acidiferrales bacterium]